jgi:HSP20 family protein
MTRHRPHHELELYREDDAYVVIAELPEADPSAIEVEWVNGHLHIAAEVESDGRQRVVSRQVTVPREIAHESITARYEEGVLEVTLPIIGQDRPQAHRIEVQ